MSHSPPIDDLTPHRIVTRCKRYVLSIDEISDDAQPLLGGVACETKGHPDGKRSPLICDAGAQMRWVCAEGACDVQQRIPYHIGRHKDKTLEVDWCKVDLVVFS
jgi:hypothetical protein